MLRIYPAMDKLVHGKDWNQAPNHAIGVCVHFKTRILLASSPKGLYFEDKEYLFGDNLYLRHDMPEIKEITMQEMSSDGTIMGIGLGNFICENATIKIAERAGWKDSLQVDISANSVDSFNAAIQALRTGELKPVGSGQTVVEKLSEKVEALEWKKAWLDGQVKVAVERIGKKDEELNFLKNRNWWQRLWDIQPPIPKKIVEYNEDYGPRSTR